MQEVCVNGVFWGSASDIRGCIGTNLIPDYDSPVSWRCRIHQLHLCRGGKTPLMSVLDMTLNHLMTSFQPWKFGEYGVPLHCHCSQVHSHLKWVLSIGQIELFNYFNCVQTNELLNWIVRDKTVWSFNCL